MQKFKQIREATQYNPYAIGMAAAKQAAGMGTAPAENLPKRVVTKGHEIAKKIKANESFDAELADLEIELFAESLSAEELSEFMMSEEFEQLDELSKSTLGSYVKKAGDDYTKREVRIDRALSKDITADTKAAEKKQSNRKTGISKAVDKLTKEEVEDLDEVSKATMASYANKSHDQLMKHTGTVNMKYGRGDKDATAYALDPVALRKTANRTKGLKQAIDKLAKG